MKKDDLISDDFLKQFKTHEELTGFLKQIQKRGIEKMLEGELDGYLDYDKHQKSSGSNVRNGHSKKKIKTSFGESEIDVPRDREASFKLSLPVFFSLPDKYSDIRQQHYICFINSLATFKHNFMLTWYRFCFNILGNNDKEFEAL